MCSKSTIYRFLLFIFCFAGINVAYAQNSLLVNLGSNDCANPFAPVFSIIHNPLSASPALLNNCDMSAQIPDYNNTFIAYNPKDNKIYINDTRHADSARIWILDMGLPNNIQCPPSIPVTADFSPDYFTNNFEFDNNGDLWSVRLYYKDYGFCLIDKYDILSGNILETKVLDFPMDNLPTDIGNGDLCILPNGRFFVTFGRDPSKLYEITNYSGGTGNATATYLQTLPKNTFGIAYINGLLEVTGTNSIDSCYYFDYNLTTNTLGELKNFQSGQAPIDNTSISPVVGATKELKNAVKLNSNSAQLTYEVFIQNMGNVILNNINIAEDLGSIFGPENISNVSTSFVPGFNTPGLHLNSLFNGTTITDLLDADQILVNRTTNNENYLFKVQIKFDVTNLSSGKIYYNSAIASGTIGSGENIINVSDSSNDGTSEVVDPNKNGIANEWGENIPTPFNFNVIPVKFISASVSKNDNLNIIEWKIATPVVNAAKFIIEYSKDGAPWQNAGEVIIVDPNQGSYQFMHPYIYSGNLLYRIKEVDKDGKSDYSSVMRLNGTNSYVEIYPNPSKNFIRINMMKNEFQNNEIELCDISGRKIFYTTTDSETWIINTTGFANGTYVLKVKNNTSISTHKVLIQH